MEAVTAALAAWAKKEAVGWLARHWKKLVAGVVVIGAAAGFLMATAVSLVAGNGQIAEASNACTSLGYSVDQAAYQPEPAGQRPEIPTGGAVPGFGPEDADKIANARSIIAAAATAGVHRRGMVVAIATALQESGLRSLDYGDRDSLGLFQQRPSQGWGSAEQVRDPQFAALAFFGGRTSPHFNAALGRASPGGLLEVAGWEELPVTVAAQRVQRSAFPNAYAKHEARATVIVDALASSTPPAWPAASTTETLTAPTNNARSTVMTAADYRAAGVDIDSFCSANFELASTSGGSAGEMGGIVPAGAWTTPLEARVTSKFGMRFHPVYHEWRLHSGTDFHAAVGTAIASPTVGVVDSVSWSSGGGLTVAVIHADGVESRHLHLSEALVKPGDQVQGGQAIALSGNSGVGTGAHYHFEVHDGGKPVDPEPFMLHHGVNLRAWS